MIGHGLRGVETAFAEFIAVLADRCQRGRKTRGERKVIVADDADVAGDGITHFFKACDDAGCDEIISAQDCGSASFDHAGDVILC